MRAALGIDINASPEEAINIYWTLADFLQKGNVEKIKVDKSLKKRQKIIFFGKKPCILFLKKLTLSNKVF